MSDASIPCQPTNHFQDRNNSHSIRRPRHALQEEQASLQDNVKSVIIIFQPPPEPIFQAVM